MPARLPSNIPLMILQTIPFMHNPTQPTLAKLDRHIYPNAKCTEHLVTSCPVCNSDEYLTRRVRKVISGALETHECEEKKTLSSVSGRRDMAGSTSVFGKETGKLEYIASRCAYDAH